MSGITPKKIRDNVYQIDADSSKGMKVPVTIYADEGLIAKMMADRTLSQAINVATLPGILGSAVVLPDGHEGYGFPVGGVAAMDAEEGMISPGGVGYDINCGVRLLRTNLSEKEVRPKLKETGDRPFQFNSFWCWNRRCNKTKLFSIGRGSGSRRELGN